MPGVECCFRQLSFNKLHIVCLEPMDKFHYLSTIYITGESGRSLSGISKGTTNLNPEGVTWWCCVGEERLRDGVGSGPPKWLIDYK